MNKDHDGKINREEVRPNFGPGGQGGNGSPEMVKTLLGFDKNGDGKLSKDELPERMQVNKDGFLSREEIEKLAASSGGNGGSGGPQGMRPDPVFSALDTDNDGVISAVEIKASSTSLSKLDKNGDGQLTQDELRPNMRPGGMRGGNPAEMIDRLFAENDKNGDGKLSKSEAPERVQEMFDRADHNKDGLLTKNELRKAFEGQMTIYKSSGK